MDPANELSTRYDASAVEPKWYARWEEAGLFSPDPDPAKPVFSMTIPPPNITGALHMGHALCYPLHDTVGRYQRMKGKSVFILPGQDHAGIATQSVVDKLLRAEGTSAFQVGREKFLERAWRWREESGGTILRQFRTLGCAFDWSANRFTLDEAYHDAVLDVFIRWFERGLIYRGQRVVNWDPGLQTSVSDIETERKLVRGKLYHVRYPFADGSGHIVVATTRPETMLGDVAVAVNPSDARYDGKVGKTLVLPLLNREIPLVADPYPDPNFGTGAVKITPAHDPNDYEVGRRHGLPMPIVLDGRARVNENGGPYAGLDRYEARKKIVEDLEARGLLEKVEDYEIPILISERSKEPIEPLLSEQWFVRMEELARPAIEAVRDGRIRFVPERYAKVYLDWMENIRDWCIGRQLWWGHRVPVYYDADGNAYAARSREDAEKKAGRPIVRQDDDVLDTWFSSGLWPFATLGWPAESELLERYYPTSLLITDRNIIYLWVARMVMMGLDFAGDIPFREVFIYATVLNEKGQRMSKSLGTGVDPVEVIDKVGADALRYTLQSQTGENQDIRYSERRTEEARNFCNKIWNATRFVLMNVRETPRRPANLEAVDRWLLSRLRKTEIAVREAYETYNLQDVCSHLYRFFWSELCDWYIEVSKSRLTRSEGESTQAAKWVLITSIEVFLKMMHPVMPHITEELYQHLPVEGRSPFLMTASWPQIPEDFDDPEAEAELERAFEITRAVRALRAELGLTPGKSIVPVAHVEGDLGDSAETFRTQAWIDRLVAGPPPAGAPHVSVTVAGVDVHLLLEGLVDPRQEIERLTREREKIASELAKIRQRLSNPNFVERAKPEVVEKERSAARELESQLDKVEARMAMFGGSV
ncbi:MAG: valine--tRNA ligase [Fimbriimonadaceae bacterium]